MFQRWRLCTAAVGCVVIVAGLGTVGEVAAHASILVHVTQKPTKPHRDPAHATRSTAALSRAKSATKPTSMRATSSAALASHVAFGAFASGFPGRGLQITQLENELGAHLTIASSFQGFGDVFPDATEKAEAAAGHTLLVSWDLGSTAGTRFTTFTDGSQDTYLAQVAAAVAAFGQPLYIRPWPEMNGDWSAFQPTGSGSQPAGGTPAQFVAAWRYLVTFFRSHGATNARWVFNPTTDTYAETTDVRTIFPGAAYVDVLGLDGYNWGNGGVLQWESFQSIYQAQYQRLVDLDPGAPVWVCEFGSKEPAESDGAPVDTTHSKADWYRTLFASEAFPAITALVFFDIDKERDWRVSSDPQSLAVVSAAVRAG
jgi:hypothetical protein